MPVAAILVRPLRAAVLLLIGLCLPVLATAAPRPADLGEQDSADLARVEAYLNGIDTLRARFLQVSSDGGYAEGDLYIDRPGNMRIDYDPPVPVIVVASGSWLIYLDTKLEQVTHIPVGSTPAGILLHETVKLSGDVTVTAFERQADALRVTLVRTKDPAEGSLTLVFSDRPLVLRKWSVIDAQGVETSVSLMETHFGETLKSDLFELDLPERSRQE